MESVFSNLPSPARGRQAHPAKRDSEPLPPRRTGSIPDTRFARSGQEGLILKILKFKTCINPACHERSEWIGGVDSDRAKRVSGSGVVGNDKKRGGKKHHLTVYFTIF